MIPFLIIAFLVVKESLAPADERVGYY